MKTVCENCGRELEGAVVYCPYCNRRTDVSFNIERLIGYIIVGVFILIVLASIGYLIFTLTYGETFPSLDFDLEFLSGGDFVDEFESLDNRDWELWRKDKGVLITTQSEELVLKNGAIGLKRRTSPGFFVECDMKIYEATSDFSWAGISFGTTNKGRYLVQLFPRRNEVVLHKVPGKIIVKKSTNIPEGGWLLLALKSEGESIGIFINEKLILKSDDVDIEEGFIGLEAVYTTALYDNFYLEELS